ncbi:Cysteine desulfurase [Labilithrix luteola]|uniref:Cysteine desulfurase n=1 Tax=Labilithrix luteola TaxID=1391654 RepID=A0A0K1Q8Y9_9BACT|nr:cysteine desulfurase family protein [Labilithrix luteola]AKV01880.1 Cysteine desulfurase [Labilithrix luteola]
MRIYLDWNATTPPLPEVLDAMRDAAARAWANPSSIHKDGRAARAVVEDARASVGALCGADARDVVFTSGGTEANNLALRSAFGPHAKAVKEASAVGEVPWLLTSRLEHPSVTRVAEALASEGRARVAWVRAKEDGTLDLEDLARAIAEAKGRVALVTVQAVNHETGVVQPFAEVASLARAAGARVHVDAVQAWGKIDLGVRAPDVCAIDPSDLGPWDTVSIAGHKIRGPKGIGALITRTGLRLEPVLLGGAQEKGLRPGTVDPLLAAAFGAAARRAQTSAASWASIAPRRDRLEAALLAIGRDARLGAPIVVGDPARRAPHVSTLAWPGWIGAELVAALDLEGVSVSSGAACSAGTVEPSPVLAAMLGEADAARGIRCSLGEDTTDAEIDEAIAAFRRVMTR